MQRVARWAFAWGVIKVLIVLVPLILGFIYLQPFFETFSRGWGEIIQMVNGANSLLLR